MGMETVLTRYVTISFFVKRRMGMIPDGDSLIVNEGYALGLCRENYEPNMWAALSIPLMAF